MEEKGLGLNTPSITSIPLSYPAELRYEPRVISGFRSVLEPSDAIEQELLDSAPNRFWGDRLKLQHESLSRMDGFLDSNPESAANPLPIGTIRRMESFSGQRNPISDALGRPRDADWSAAEADASFGCQDDDEPLRFCV